MMRGADRSATEHLADRLDSADAIDAALDLTSTEIDALIATADMVRAIANVPAPPLGLHRGRSLFIAAGVARAEHAATHSRRSPLGRVPERMRAGIVLAGAILAIVLTTSIAAGSLPGDVLYPIKRLDENIQLALANDAARPLIEAGQLAARRAEANALTALGRASEVRFEGVLESAAKGFAVDGMLLDLSSARELPALSVLTAGARVLVHARTTEDHRLVVIRLVVLEHGPPATTPVAQRAEGVIRKRPTDPQPTPAAALPTPTPPTTPTIPASPTPEATAVATATIDGAEVRAPSGGDRATRVHWRGVLESMDGDRWTVDGRTFVVVSGRIDTRGGPVKIGALVEVRAEERDGVLHLLELVVISPNVTPEAIEWRGVIEVVAGDRLVVGGHEVIIVPDTHIVGTPEVGRVASVQANRIEGAVPVAIRIVVEPAETLVEFVGKLESMDDSVWIFDGREVQINEETVIEGAEPTIGALVEVTAVEREDGTLIALKLYVLPTTAMPPPSATAAPSSTPPTATTSPPISGPTPGPTDAPIPATPSAAG